MRLIDAEELTKSIEKAKEITKVACERMETNTIGHPDIVHRCSIIMLEKTLEVINLCETVEIRPKGKWEEVMTTGKLGFWYSMTQCSVCKNEVPILQDGGGCEFLSDFCPYCGADMREGE